MQILVISDNGAFYLTVFHACRRLLAECPVTHHSIQSWQLVDLATVAPQTLIIMHPQDARRMNLIVDDSTGVADQFAVVRGIDDNLAECGTPWECLNHQALLLRIQEFARTASGVPVMSERRLVDSPCLRMAEFRVPTSSHLIPVIRDRLLQGIEDFQLASDSVVNHFCMALDEALANAFYHGNLELCSSLKEDGSSRFLELARQREQQQPYHSRTISIHELAAPFGLWLTIQDQGQGFDVQTALDRANDPELMLASGRGLLMMQAFSDEVFFNPCGNSVTLVLYSRQPATAAGRDFASRHGPAHADREVAGSPS